MNTVDKIRCQWVQACLEGRFATADFLSAYLPPVQDADLIRPPVDNRERWGTAGEILGR